MNFKGETEKKIRLNITIKDEESDDLLDIIPLLIQDLVEERTNNIGLIREYENMINKLAEARKEIKELRTLNDNLSSILYDANLEMEDIKRRMCAK